MSIATASDFEIAPARPILTPLAAAAACVALADWLFYGWEIGISLALFFGVLGVVAVVGNGAHATRNTQLLMTAVFAAGLIALTEDVNILSVIWAALATAMFVIVITAYDDSSWRRQLFEAATTPFRGPFQLVPDLFTASKQIKRQMPKWLRVGSLVAWIVPIGAFAVFLALFASANPLIEYRLMQIDLSVLFKFFDLSRMLFWALVACIIWPLILRRMRRRPDREPKPRAAENAATAMICSARRRYRARSSSSTRCSRYRAC